MNSDNPEHHNQPEHYSIAQAATHLGRSELTVRRMIKRKKLNADLHHGPHGPEYRIPASALLTLNRTFNTVFNLQSENPGHFDEPDNPAPSGGGLQSPGQSLLPPEERDGWSGSQDQATRDANDAAIGSLLKQLENENAFLRQQLEERGRSECELRRLLELLCVELSDLRRVSATAAHREEAESPAAESGPAGRDSPSSPQGKSTTGFEPPDKGAAADGSSTGTARLAPLQEPARRRISIQREPPIQELPSGDALEIAGWTARSALQAWLDGLNRE